MYVVFKEIAWLHGDNILTSVRISSSGYSTCVHCTRLSGALRIISSNDSASLSFSYLPPSVAAISPSLLTMDSRQSGYLLAVQGNNVGLATVSVTLPLLGVFSNTQPERLITLAVRRLVDVWVVLCYRSTN